MRGCPLSQRKDSLYLTIDLKEVQDLKVTLESDKVAFSGKVGGSLYEFSFEWYAPIKKEESKWSTKRLIEFYLKKETEDTWPTIRKDKGKAPWIKVDWKRWQDSDDEDEKAGGFDLNGMGDMNFGDMGGGDDFDSDDEDLPDLEPSSEAMGSGAASSETKDEQKEDPKDE
mmetsp:Transcript_93131/g.263236  ORF Transcript_93131/g.263236 Transcript_93131/m.263236 type:complete len:170 (-) Transcript_93131:423-932(-)